MRRDKSEREMGRANRRGGKCAKDGSPADVFTAVAEQIRSAGEIYDQCVTGLDELVSAARELRKRYITNTSKLEKLRRMAGARFDE